MTQTKRLLASGIVAALLSALPLQAQSTATKPQFEVTSVKPDTDCELRPGPRGLQGPTPGRVTITCATLRELILWGYVAFGNGPRPDLKEVPILAGPDWMASDRYTIAAKAEGNPPLSEMYGPMLQALLETRFHLKLHRETREGPVYAVTVAKGGLKLKPAGACVPLDLDHLPPELADGGPRPSFCGDRIRRNSGTNTMMELAAGTMAEWAAFFSDTMDRDVIDKTGLTGRFNVHLEFAADDSTPKAGGTIGYGDSGPPAPPVDASLPSIFAAVQAQLGLKLDAAKGPQGVLVIDRAEKPSVN